MNTANQIINEILSAGAKFILDGGEVGLTQIVDDDLLQHGRSNKHKIKQILLAIQRESRNPSPKIWELRILSSDGKRIDGMTMIDKHRLSRDECKLWIGSLEKIVSLAIKKLEADYIC